MRLSPLDIRQKEFRRSMRGYSEDDVDVFLDAVADELERLEAEHAELQEKALRLKEQVARYEELKETLQNTLVTAQQQADDVREKARREADTAVRDGELRARGIVAEAEAEKTRVQHRLVELRKTEEDFRQSFRALLEAHLNLLAEDEVSEERGQFRGLVASVEQELELPEDLPPAGPVAGSGSEQPSTTTDVHAAAAAAAAHQNGEPDLRGYAARLPDFDDTVTPSRDATADDASSGSSVRRFLFGRKDRDSSDAPGEEDRDFQW